jgi:hypothetical protein
MNTARDDQWADRDGTAESEAARGTVVSRRLLLGGAAGGFALATSRLLLPDWLVEEAQADNHPIRRVQQRQERRRHKRGDQRHRRHERRKPTKRGQGLGAGGWKNLQIRFTNGPAGGGPTLAFEVWQNVDNDPAEGHWSRVDQGMAEWGRLYTFHVFAHYAALWIEGGKYVAGFGNPLFSSPYAVVGTGGTFDGSGWHNGTRVNYAPLPENYCQGCYVSMPAENGNVFDVDRLSDEGEEKVFWAHIQPPRPKLSGAGS